MGRIEMLCLALGLALCCSIAVEGQNQSTVASKVTEVLKDKEVGWSFVGAIESGRVPIVPSEKRVLVGIWESPKVAGVSESVYISIYEVENPAEAAVWLKPVRKGQVADGWKISGYRIGDEGYLANYRDGKRFEIQFRSGGFVGKIAGNELRRVQEFAKYIVAQIPTN
jgi:hypothetical protein